MRKQRWAWLLPALTLTLGAMVSVDVHGPALRVVVALRFAASLGVGVAWQVLYRRDVVDRFFPLAAIFVILTAAGLLVGAVSLEDGDGDDRSVPLVGLAVPSIAAGVILAEARIRSRERHRQRAEAEVTA